MKELFERDYSPYEKDSTDIHLPLDVIVRSRELVESRFDKRRIGETDTLNLYLLDNGVAAIGHVNHQYIRLYALSKEGLDKLAEEIELSKAKSS